MNQKNRLLERAAKLLDRIGIASDEFDPEASELRYAIKKNLGLLKDV